MAMEDDLLKPRHKVIAVFPGSVKPVGFVITDSDYYRDQFNIDDYPHLFKKINWWEHRTIEQLTGVKYVKVVEYVGYWLVGDVVPVESFVFEDGKRMGYQLSGTFHPIPTVRPATETEYSEFKSKQSNMSTQNEELKVGDKVEVLDQGLLMLEKFAPKGAGPNSHGTISKLMEDGWVMVEFPIANDNPKGHSQIAPYPVSIVRKLK